jgi:lipopolysaccharide export LptBFGC system permease protein LptF
MREPGYKALTTAGLLRQLQDKYGMNPPPDNEQAAREVRNIWLSIYSRSGLAMSALAFALIGVPLGILARQAHMLSAFLLGCLPVMIVYYPVFLMGQSMADQGTIPAIGACWTPDGVLAAIGVGLLGWLFVR